MFHVFRSNASYIWLNNIEKSRDNSSYTPEEITFVDPSDISLTSSTDKRDFLFRSNGIPYEYIH